MLFHRRIAACCVALATCLVACKSTSDGSDSSVSADELPIDRDWVATVKGKFDALRSDVAAAWPAAVDRLLRTGVGGPQLDTVSRSHETCRRRPSSFRTR
jgi:hypothetical protein